MSLVSTPELLCSIDGHEVWHGDSLDPATVDAVMGGRRADLLHVDAPYSARTHGANRRLACYDGRPGSHEKMRNPIPYDAWTVGQVENLCDLWCDAASGWVTTVTDHGLAPAWERGFEASGRYVFSPLCWVEIGSRVRLLGDGPSSWGCWVVVARPKKMPWSKWGTLPGAYVGNREGGAWRPDRIVGGKSLRLTRQLIEDYSRPGDLVLDPCLGGGTTMIAARAAGRRCIGIEIDRDRAELCVSILSGARRVEGQSTLFDFDTTGAAK